MPRLVPSICREERITLGTYERGLLKEYLELQRNKEINENLTEITTTTINGVAMVLASIPLVVGTVAAAWIGKEAVTSEQGKGFLNALSGGWLDVIENYLTSGPPVK